jgi:succinoglycan biosynthesis transport protein ExoP
VVEIWFASHDPALAADIVNAYAEAYIADGIRATMRSAEERADWMEARLQDLRTEAEAAAEAAEQVPPGDRCRRPAGPARPGATGRGA